MKVHLTDGTPFLPDSVLEDVTAIVGRRGRGKTNTAVVLVEEGQRHGMRFCVVDPVGVWWGLRSSRDGKAAGIPVVVMGGEHAMVPLEPTAGKIVADFMAQPGPSVVLDFRLMRKGEITRFMADFLERLYFKNRDPLLLVLDEADKFAPQRPFGEEARMLGAAEDVVKMGRARGLHTVLITQRPATLNKNVITQAGVLIAHGLPAPQDQKAIDAWIVERADEEHRAEFLSTLGGLDRGEAWVWAPELEVFKRVQIRQRHTFDSSATPKRGERRAAPRVLAEVDLDKLSAEIKATAERAKADDPRTLKARIAELERQVAAKPAAGPAPPPVEVPVLKPEEVKHLTAAVDRLADIAETFAINAQDIKNHRNAIVAALNTATRALSARPAGGALPRPQARVTSPDGVGRPAKASRPAPVVPGDPGSVGNSGLRRILIALAQRPAGLSKRQIGVRAGISSKSGTFDTYMSRARTAGWIEGRGVVTITPAGVEALGAFDPLPSGRDLLEYWLADLGSSGAARILRALADAYPGSLTKAELAAAASLTGSSGTFDTYMSRLRSLELVEGRGEIRASEELFS